MTLKEVHRRACAIAAALRELSAQAAEGKLPQHGEGMVTKKLDDGTYGPCCVFGHALAKAGCLPQQEVEVNWDALRLALGGIRHEDELPDNYDRKAYRLLERMGLDVDYIAHAAEAQHTPWKQRQEYLARRLEEAAKSIEAWAEALAKEIK